MIFTILIHIILNMTSLSITISDTIAKASNEAEKELGVSRTEFIRRAIIHELDDFKTRSEEIGIKVLTRSSVSRPGLAHARLVATYHSKTFSCQSPV